jgi:hypothetical protein
MTDLHDPAPTREELLALLTETHEQVVTSPFFGGRRVLIREITARQRLQANAAAQAATPDNPDNALYRAMLVQMSVVNPQSGTPYADGRPGPDGAPLIDPRTRTPLFTIEDVADLADGRDLALDALVTKIAALAGVGPRAMFRRSAPADGAKRDARTGADAAGGTGDPAAAARPDDAHERGALVAEPADGYDEPGSLEPGRDPAPGARPD